MSCSPSNLRSLRPVQATFGDSNKVTLKKLVDIIYSPRVTLSHSFATSGVCLIVCSRWVCLFVSLFHQTSLVQQFEAAAYTHVHYTNLSRRIARCILELGVQRASPRVPAVRYVATLLERSATKFCGLSEVKDAEGEKAGGFNQQRMENPYPTCASLL